MISLWIMTSAEPEHRWLFRAGGSRHVLSFAATNKLGAIRSGQVGASTR